MTYIMVSKHTKLYLTLQTLKKGIYICVGIEERLCASRKIIMRTAFPILFLMRRNIWISQSLPISDERKFALRHQLRLISIKLFLLSCSRPFFIAAVRLVAVTGYEMCRGPAVVLRLDTARGTLTVGTAQQDRATGRVPSLPPHHSSREGLKSATEVHWEGPQPATPPLQ